MSDRPEEMDERDVDERFASIVAGWATPSSEEPGAAERAGTDPGTTDGATSTETAPEPPQETAEPTATPARPSGVNPSLFDLGGASTWRVPTAPEPSGPRDTPAPADAVEDEHYDPPEVQLPPQEDLHFWAAVLGLVAGPLCLVYVAMARPFHSTRWFIAGLALSLLGFGLLVLRQPRDRDHGDDGARL